MENNANIKTHYLRRRLITAITLDLRRHSSVTIFHSADLTMLFGVIVANVSVKKKGNHWIEIYIEAQNFMLTE